MNSLSDVVRQMVVVENSTFLGEEKVVGFPYAIVSKCESFYFDLVMKIVEQNSVENIVSKCNFGINEKSEIVLVEKNLIQATAVVCDKTVYKMWQKLVKDKEKFKFQVSNVEKDDVVILYKFPEKHFKRIICIQKPPSCTPSGICWIVNGGCTGKVFVKFCGVDPLFPVVICHVETQGALECCVCGDETTNKLMCRHQICRPCFRKWRESSSTCPVCRSVMYLDRDWVTEEYHKLVVDKKDELWILSSGFANWIGVSVLTRNFCSADRYFCMESEYDDIFNDHVHKVRCKKWSAWVF